MNSGGGGIARSGVSGSFTYAPTAGYANTSARNVSFVDTMRVTAIRETFEETGVWLGAPLADAERKRRELLDKRIAFRELANEAPIDLAQLVWTSRWITPAGIPKRFDTYFFLAIV